MSAERPDRADVARVLGIGTGLVLALIGVRFALDPQNAATFFGIDRNAPGFSPHYAIALRDIWLGGLAIAFAWTRQWGSLGLWFALAALVCFGDAAIAASSSGRWVSMAFHTASGVFCAAMAFWCRRLSGPRRDT